MQMVQVNHDRSTCLLKTIDFTQLVEKFHAGDDALDRNQKARIPPLDHHQKLHAAKLIYKKMRYKVQKLRRQRPL